MIRCPVFQTWHQVRPTKDITKSSVTLLVLRPRKCICHLLHLRNKKLRLDFIALKQHALSTNLTIFRTECDKPQLVYAHKRPHNILREFKQITSDLLLTCDTTVSELTDNSKDSSQLPIRSNLTCLILVEKLYYSAGYDACCCHCGSKRKLVTNINAIHFPLCVNVKTRNK